MLAFHRPLPDDGGLPSRHLRRVSDTVQHRPRAWSEWIAPGGIAWVGLAVYVALLLASYGISAGYLPARHAGLECDLTGHGMRAVDVARAIGGDVVRDPDGTVRFDPRTDALHVYVIEPGGDVRLAFASRPERNGAGHVVIVIPSRGIGYGEFVTGFDRLTTLLRDDGVEQAVIQVARPPSTDSSGPSGGSRSASRERGF